MIKEITENLYKFSFKAFSSNCYLLYHSGKKIMIDTGSHAAREELLNDFNNKNLNFDDTDIVLLTHLHWDHSDNISLFKRAKIYASFTEIEDFQNKSLFGSQGKFDEIDKVKILPLSSLKIKNIEVIETPGHTRGSVAFYLPKEKILFSGDTIFDKDAYSIGRTDLPESIPKYIESSIKKLLSLDFKILCPGHDV